MFSHTNSGHVSIKLIKLSTLVLFCSNCLYNFKLLAAYPDWVFFCKEVWQSNLCGNKRKEWNWIQFSCHWHSPMTLQNVIRLLLIAHSLSAMHSVDIESLWCDQIKWIIIKKWMQKFKRNFSTTMNTIIFSSYSKIIWPLATIGHSLLWWRGRDLYKRQQHLQTQFGRKTRANLMTQLPNSWHNKKHN